MKALRIFQPREEARLVDLSSAELTPGEVHVQTHYSSLNYKDALALTGSGQILKKFPLNPGIDVSGVVLSSSDPHFKKGDSVLVTGCGIGEETDGGLAQEIKVKSSFVIPLPETMSLETAMFFGTAGFTAALAIHRLLVNDQTPEKGPILVTGATGGVGSFSVALLKHLGFEVIALTGKKTSQHENLQRLGAHKVMTLSELQLGSRPLEKGLFGGAIDNLGGEVLAQTLAHTRLWGNVASIGLAMSPKLETTVMPFILRGVSLLGTSSNNCTLSLRHEIWKKLSTNWKAPEFQFIPKQVISMEDTLRTAKEMLNQKTVGRTLVQIKEES